MLLNVTRQQDFLFNILMKPYNYGVLYYFVL